MLNAENVEAQPIRLLLADNTPMGNELLAGVLGRDSRFQVRGSGATAEQVLAEIVDEVDVVVISSTLGGPGGGARLTRRLLAAHSGITAVMLLECQARDAVVEAFRAGANGVFSRAEPIEVLCRCIESVHQGKVWARDEELKFILEELASSFPSPAAVQRQKCSLSRREQNIVRLVAEGLTNRQIAAELSLNEHTLKSSLQHLFEKLSVSRRAEMVFAASVRALPEKSDPIVLETRSESVHDDHSRYEIYSRAAEHALPFAQFAVGEMCLHGRGTTRDLVSAYAWFLLAEATATRIVKTSRAYLQSLTASMTDTQVAEAEHRARKMNPQGEGGRYLAKRRKEERLCCAPEKANASGIKNALLA